MIMSCTSSQMIPTNTDRATSVAMRYNLDSLTDSRLGRMGIFRELSDAVLPSRDSYGIKATKSAFARANDADAEFSSLKACFGYSGRDCKGMDTLLGECVKRF